MKDIILASASPRRREILEAIGLPHRVVISKVEERVPVMTEPAEVAQNLARQKALAVAQDLDNGVVIGADTIVVLKGQVLGKPANRQEAVEMLQALSGTIHHVITGIAVLDVETRKMVLTHELTEVAFKDIELADIEAYVDTGEPEDKAGAYGIQGLGGLFVKGIKGCYFNVVGLPMPLLAEVLKQFDIDVLRFGKII